MESLVLQKEKGVCSDSPSIWFHSVAGVYLGHGGRCRSLKDMQILEALQRQGVISHIYPW